MAGSVDRLVEQVLVLRAQAGDAAAWGDLIQHRGPPLRYFLRKMLGDPLLAEDVLQDVWFDVIRGLPRLRQAAAFPAWVYRIARDRVHRTLRRRRGPDTSLGEANFPAAPEPEGEFKPEEAGHVHAALDELAPEHREVLVLRFLEEMPYEDIARVVGCQLGTVRSRLHYAKRALRRVLEGRDRHE